MTDSIKDKLYHIIFEAETPSGKFFDISLLVVILLSIICIVLESVDRIHLAYGDLLFQIEWVFTILFTIEYFIRIYVVRNKFKYIFSFMGIVDLLAIIPTYLIFIADLHDLISSISIEAYDCRSDAFDEILQSIRPHKGQLLTAENIREILDGSEIQECKNKHVQDPYSFRCIPQTKFQKLIHYQVRLYLQNLLQNY